MKAISTFAMSLVAATGLALLIPAGAYATVGSGPVEVCTTPTAAYTFTVNISVASDGTPIATPSTNKNGTCVMGGDIISFDTSALPSGATWSAKFPTPTAGGLFQNNCKFGNGSNESSSCTVVASPPSGTYSYSVTVNGHTLDPRVIIKGATRRRRPHPHLKPKPSASPQP